jgi:hypothetical protein
MNKKQVIGTRFTLLNAIKDRPAFGRIQQGEGYYYELKSL